MRIYQNVTSNKFLEHAFYVLRNWELNRKMIEEQQRQEVEGQQRRKEEERRKKEEEKRLWREEGRQKYYDDIRSSIAQLQEDMKHTSPFRPKKYFEDQICWLLRELENECKPECDDVQEEEQEPQEPQEIKKRSKTNNAEIMNNILPALILIFSEIIQFQRNSISAIVSGNIAWQQRYKEFVFDIDEIARKALAVVKKTQTTKITTITLANSIAAAQRKSKKTSEKVSPKAKARLKKSLIETALFLAEYPTSLLMMDTSEWREGAPEKTPKGPKWTTFFDVNISWLNEELKKGVVVIPPDKIFPLVERKEKRGKTLKATVPPSLSIPSFFFGGSSIKQNTSKSAFTNKLETTRRRIGLFDSWVNYKTLLELARKEGKSKAKAKAKQAKQVEAGAKTPEQVETEAKPKPTKQIEVGAKTPEQAEAGAKLAKQVKGKLKYPILKYCSIFGIPNLEEFKTHEKLHNRHNGCQKQWIDSHIKGPFKRFNFFKVTLNGDWIQIEKNTSKFPKENDDEY